MAGEKTYFIVHIDDETRLYHAVPKAFHAAVQSWLQQDQAYIDGALAEGEWLGFTDYMRHAGFQPLTYMPIFIS